jgi:hypothetical protein
MPALLLTTVKFLRSVRSRTALMSVLGTPEKPNPPTRTVESDFISLMASCAEGYILLMAHRLAELEKKRIAGALRRAAKRYVRCIVKVEELRFPQTTTVNSKAATTALVDDTAYLEVL